MEEQIKHSENYIKKIVGKETGFSIPKNYFSDVDTDIHAKVLKSKIGNTNLYEVPKDYFDKVDEEILGKVSLKVVQIGFRKKLIKFIPYAAAACILLFIGLNKFVFTNTNSIDNLSDVDLEYWLESNPISTLEIVDVLKTDLLQENDFTLATLEDSSIEEFIENYDDISMLNE